MDVEVQRNEIKNGNDNRECSINTLKSLTFEEQLRKLLGEGGASAEKAAFENCIWTIDYHSLRIDESEGYYIVRNNLETNRLLLTTDAFKDFLAFYAGKVQELTTGTLPDVKLFNNLTILKCSLRHKRIDDFLCNAMAEILKNLESLHLKEMDMESGGECLCVSSQFLENLLKMNKLKCLQLDYFFATKIKYEQFVKLISALALEQLQGNLELESDSENIETSNLPNLTLKTLQITTTLRNVSSFSEILRNLQSLSLKITEETDDTALALLASSPSCQNLNKLIISGTTFTNLTMFPIPSKVNELHLKWCRGLTHKNLQQILSESQIKEFSSVCTKYEGDFEDFAISPSIETLKIDRVDMCNFRGAYRNHKALKTLTWYHTRNCTGNSGDREKLSELPQAACLEYEDFEMEPKNQIGIIKAVGLNTCRNLESLDMGYKCQLALESLLELKDLQQLSTWIMDSTIQQWTYILALLKHSSLQELTISFIRNTTEVPIASCQTKVSHLKVIDFNFCEKGLDFFLDIFHQNRHIKISLFLPPLAFVKPLRNLINHKKFPTFLKTIEIYGYTIGK